MATQNDGTKPGTETAVHDHAVHPEAGSGMREESRSFDPKVGAERDVKLEGAKGGGGDGPDPAAASELEASADDASEPEIAADDAGASAMAERVQKQNDDVEQR